MAPTMNTRTIRNTSKPTDITRKKGSTRHRVNMHDHKTLEQSFDDTFSAFEKVEKMTHLKNKEKILHLFSRKLEIMEQLIIIS